MSRRPAAATPVRILIADEECLSRRALARALEALGCSVAAVDGADPALEHAAADPGALDLVFADARLPGGGAALISRLRELDAHLPCVLLHSGAAPSEGVAALRAGALCSLAKPLERERDALQELLELALARRRAGGRGAGAQRAEQHRIVGRSPTLRECLALVDRVARSEASVLITGESGTGKELVARAIHDGRPARASAPSSRSTAARSPRTLLESETLRPRARRLHRRRGRDRVGRFESGRRRHAVPRRDRRHGPAAAGEAAARAAGRHVRAGRRASQTRAPTCA